MLIKSLSLKEFKCFEQVDIDFGKITLLTGANSSGKSSLINALLGIMQSKYFPQYFALNGELVNMGGFDDVLRKKAKKGIFEIGIKIETYIDRIFFTKWSQDVLSELPNLIEFKNEDKHLFIHRDKTVDEELYIPEEEYIKLKKKIETNYQYRLTPIEMLSIAESNYRLLKKIDSKKRIVFKTKYEEALYSLDDFFFELHHNTPYIFNYVSSFRLPPERTYYRKPNANKIGVNGEGYIDQIIEWEESNHDKFQELFEAVTTLGLFHSIESNKMKGGRFELNVKVNENSTLASLTDVGFGISQFLPIIVADLQLNSHSCLAVSQPEIHLHPKIQATLGDYFAKQVNETKKQYIVETHSEYLINRLRLLIVKGELQPEDVKLYYMENDGDKTTTYPIELTTDGQIKNAPQGFFDTYEMDVMDIALFASAQ